MQAGVFDPAQALPDAFFDVAAQVYCDDPYWLGENPQQVRARFSRANGFFQQGNAWVGVEAGQARLAGFVHPLQQIDGRPVAFFGFWETDNNLEVNRDLFAGLEAWARDQGAVALYGPIDFNTYGANRLRLQDFDKPCFPGEPYNPEYYPELLAQLGFDIVARYQSRYHPDVTTLGESLLPRLQQSREALAGSFQMKSLTPEFWLDNLDELYPLVDVIFRQNFAYTPIDRQQFGSMCGETFARRFCPRSSVLATTTDGAIAGFFLCFPDYGPLLRQAAGVRVDAAELNYADHYPLLPKPRLGLAKTGGVHPSYRQSGLFNWMGLQLVVNISHHYERLVGALMREDNPSQRFGQICPIPRDYGMFRKHLSN